MASEKRYILIPIDSDLSDDRYEEMAARLSEAMPEYMVILVVGMRGSATVVAERR